MHSTLFSLTIVVAIFCAAHVAHAQYTTDATCTPDFDWAKDQQQRSPCLVAAYVQGACTARIFNVPALNMDEYYILPTKLSECGCTTACYNLLSACAACQGSSPPRFPYWINNCTIAGLLDNSTYFPLSKWPIPDGVQIPLWAQKDPRLWSNMQFNTTEARQIAASGILNINALSSSSSTTSTTTTSSSSPSSTSSAASASPNDNHTETGAIVGGVVGGVLGLILIGALMLWVTRRREPSYGYAGSSM